MFMLARVSAVLASCLVAAASASAATAPAASASAGAVVFSVVDLDPGDGQSPVFSWQTQNALSVTVITRGPVFQFSENRDEKPGWNQVLQTSSQAYGGVANASVNAQARATDASARLESTDIPFGSWSNSGAFGYFNGTYTLVGAGAVYASVPYQLNVSAACGEIVCATVSASAGVGFESAQGNNGSLLQLGYEIQAVGTGSDSQTGVLDGIVIRNTQGGVLEGSLLFGVNAGALAQPVPEPSTYAMLLAGLALVAWATRRRLG